MSGGSAVAMAYAIKHPERVSRLVLYGTVCGRPPTFEGDEIVEEETYRNLIRVGWAREDPVFRRVFTSRFIPDATEEQMRWFDDLQRMATSPENAVASRIGRQEVDIEADLHRITAPTLILQALGDRSTTFENAPDVAARVPNARLVPLESNNHILLADEPAWPVFLREVTTFLAPDRLALPPDADQTVAELSAARDRRPPPRRRRPDERADRRGADAEHPDRRAAPLERLPEAGADRPGRARRCRRRRDAC